MKRTCLTVAVALVITGCGGSGEPVSKTTSKPATTTTTATTTGKTTETTQTTTGIDTMPGAGTQPVVVKATNTDTALLSDVRAARHEGYDRVVFQFANTLPGYDVRYVQRPIVQDGSGKVMTVDGAYVLRVRMENALDADLTKASAPPTYTGPQRIKPSTPEIAELLRTGGFEGILTWVIGARDRVDFRVTTLDSPPRLIVDLRNH